MIIWDKNPEGDRLLSELWAGELSARQIAERIAGASKNSIIARARRLGLPQRRPTPAPRGEARERIRKVTLRPKRIIVPPPEQIKPTEGPGRLLFDLKRRDCHAITVDGIRGHKLALYCASPTAREEGPPYCEYHSSIFYRR